MSEQSEFKYIGKRTIRPDGFDKVTGRANYGADLALPGMVWGKVLRSPHAHAKILSIDTSRAEAHPDVLAVATHADFHAVSHEAINAGEGSADMLDLASNCLARDKALYHGHAVAAVAARTKAAAANALSLIDVQYEVLPHVLDLDEAMREGAPLLHEDMFTEGYEEKPGTPSNIATRSLMGIGDVDAGFADADIIIEREFTTPTAHQGYIEPHACTARYDEDGQSTIWCCTQGHFDVRTSTSKLLSIELSKLKVVASEIGGGFGGKTVVYQEPVALLLSKKAHRPVKMVMDRDEVFTGTGPTPAAKLKVKLGAKNDGTITAMKGYLAFEAGAFKGSPMTPGVMTMFAPYDCPNMQVEGFDVVLNKPKAGAYRAPGAPQAEFAAEMAINELADRLEMDPIDLRLMNAAKEGTQTIYGPKFRRIGFVECLEAAKNSEHYRSAVKDGQGRSVAAGFWFNIGGQSSVTINLNTDGSGTIIEGSPDIGGSRASMQMMAAEVLQIDPAHLKPIVADTDALPYVQGTGGSRVTFATGMATIEAAEQIIEELKTRAAAVWNVTADQVEYEAGTVKNMVSDETMTMTKICGMAVKTGGQISATANINAKGAGPSFAVHICDVAVDQDTGKVDVDRYTAIQDAGKAIHPGYVEGQLQGGAVQGIGWALNEEYVFNEAGVMQNPGFLDYRIPLASDLPMIDAIVVEVPNTAHPYGVRGVGEAGIIPPLAAVGYAVGNAIGVQVSELPCSPPKVLEMLSA